MILSAGIGFVPESQRNSFILVLIRLDKKARIAWSEFSIRFIGRQEWEGKIDWNGIKKRSDEADEGGKGEESRGLSLT